MELALLIIASVIAGFLLCAHFIARRRKCSTTEVIRGALTIQRAAMRSRNDRHCPA